MKLEPKSVFEKLCALDPCSPLSHFTLGRHLYQQGAWRDAVVALERSLAADADYLLAYLFLGQALEKSGDLKRAKEIYQAGVASAERLNKVDFVAQFRALLKTMTM